MSKLPKIGILSPITHNLPPGSYGPWEQVVYNLQEELVKLGVDVTVFATKKANIAAKVEYLFEEPTGDKDGDEKTAVALLHTVNFLKQANKFDVLHLHHNIAPVLLTELTTTPSVTTLHGCGVEKNYDLYYDHLKTHNFISISNFERTFRPDLNYIDTVFNGVDTTLYDFRQQPGEYLLFSGRVVHDKGVHNAIALSQKAGLPLKIAGPITDQKYFDEQVKPYIDNKQIEYLGNLDQKTLSQVITHAIAGIFLIEWDEPFGLSIVDSLVSGVPVICNRRGAQPELINSPELGILVNSLDEAVDKISELQKISRADCKNVAQSRFSRATMAKKYLDNYIKLAL
jgi:glycosyltransferase involved in cell wall biosynthesis